jgi:hypothetical protein
VLQRTFFDKEDVHACNHGRKAGSTGPNEIMNLQVLEGHNDFINIRIQGNYTSRSCVSQLQMPRTFIF